MVQTSFIVALVAILSATSNVVALPLAINVSARDVEVRSATVSAAQIAKKFAKDLAEQAWDHKMAKDVITGNGPISNSFKKRPADPINHDIHSVVKPAPPLVAQPALSPGMQENLQAWRIKAAKKA